MKISLTFQGVRLPLKICTLLLPKAASDNGEERDDPHEVLSPPEDHESRPAQDHSSHPLSVSPAQCPAGALTSTSNPLTRKQKNALRYREKRAAKRQREAEISQPLSDEEGLVYPYGTGPPPKKRQARYLDAAAASASPAPLSLSSPSFSQSRVTSSGFQGTCSEGASSLPSLSGLLEDGFVLDEWDGREPRFLVDEDSRPLTILVGRPKDKREEENAHKGWGAVVGHAAQRLEESRPHCRFSPEDVNHRRGKFPALAHGISFGGGRKVLGLFCNNKANTAVLEGLVADESVRRIAGFQSAAFQLYLPAVAAYYWGTLKAIVSHSRFFSPNFVNSAFAAITFNFGPSTVCLKHTDFNNLSWGWCAVTALGDFDYTKGGHLVLWELKRIIPFPAGSTILLPSALLSHGNLPIQAGESRYSVTQYSAAGVFRWVENGMKSDKAFKDAAKVDELRRWEESRASRWVKGLAMFPIISMAK